MSDQAISAQFGQVSEYLAELARDVEHVERKLVRVTKVGSRSPDRATTRVDVVASAIVAGRLCTLRVHCGELWGVGETDAQVQDVATALVRRLEEGLAAAGLEVRQGVWRHE